MRLLPIDGGLNFEDRGMGGERHGLEREVHFIAGHGIERYGFGANVRSSLS